VKVLQNFTHFQRNIKNQKPKLSQVSGTGEAVTLQLNQSIGLKALRHSDMGRCCNKLIKSYPVQQIRRHLVFYSWYFFCHYFNCHVYLPVNCPTCCWYGFWGWSWYWGGGRVRCRCSCCSCCCRCFS